jgi:hypothetical protein
MIDQLQEGNVLKKSDLHIYPQSVAQHRPEALLFQRSVISSFATPSIIIQEEDDMFESGEGFRTEQANKALDQRLSFVSCDTHEL